jgi:septal ring factor EnvC (AmiA/AmiB activator)
MINIILCVNIIIFLFIGNFLFNQRKQLLHWQEHSCTLGKSIEQLIKDHPMLINADLRFAKQLREINSQLVSMDNQLQDLENKRDNDGGYQHALRILEMGGNKDEIVESCHLSNAEAELLMNLQAYRSAMKAN